MHQIYPVLGVVLGDQLELRFEGGAVGPVNQTWGDVVHPDLPQVIGRKRRHGSDLFGAQGFGQSTLRNLVGAAAATRAVADQADQQQHHSHNQQLP